MRRVVFLIAATGVLVASCQRSAVTWPPAIQMVSSPAGNLSSEPQLTATDGGVILSWVEHDGQTTALKYAERTRGAWGAARTAAAGADWFVSYADPPTVMRMSDGTLVAEWTRQTDPVREAMDLVLSRSTDNGKTWSAPFTPHHDGTKTQHAFPSLFELPGRGLGLLWLDGRETILETDDDAGPPMTMRYAAFDREWKQTADVRIAAKVCECCATAAAATDSGVIAAYRNRSDKEIRDIYVTRLENGAWSDGMPVHEDNWRVLACPVNGPAISARGRTVAVAWFVAKNDEGHAYAALSSDAGRTWGNAIRLDDASSLGRVSIDVLDDGTAAAAWIEFAGGHAQLELRRIDPSGMRSPAISLASVTSGSTSGFPKMARQGNDMVFAWTESMPGPDEDATTKVRTAVASLR
jgi:hypothetical protein